MFCPEGTHNPSGSDTCTPCEPNTISLKGRTFNFSSCEICYISFGEIKILLKSMKKIRVMIGQTLPCSLIDLKLQIFSIVSVQLLCPITKP